MRLRLAAPSNGGYTSRRVGFPGCYAQFYAQASQHRGSDSSETLVAMQLGEVAEWLKAAVC